MVGISGMWIKTVRREAKISPLYHVWRNGGYHAYYLKVCQNMRKKCLLRKSYAVGTETVYRVGRLHAQS